MAVNRESVGRRPLSRLWLWLLLLMLFQAQPGLAHSLQIEGDVGVLMHVDPGDEPVAGGQAALMFEMQDRHGRFSLDRCDCRLRISRNNIEIFDGAIIGDRPAAAIVPFVFADSGMHRAEVSGNPRPGATFPPFHVVFDVRVVPDTAPSDTSMLSLWRVLREYWLTAVMVLMVLLGCGYAASRRR